jgi:hypothetical protein
MRDVYVVDAVRAPAGGMAAVLGRLAERPEFDQAIPAPRGGAVAAGHPPGASGPGVATLRIGVGQGRALVLER